MCKESKSGGGGGSLASDSPGNISAYQKVSALDVAREISRQFADAKKQAYNRRAYILEYTDTNGETTRFYNAGGGRYERKRRPEYERMFPDNAQRVYKAEFQAPDEWGIMKIDRRTGQINVRKKDSDWTGANANAGISRTSKRRMSDAARWAETQMRRK